MSPAADNGSGNGNTSTSGAASASKGVARPLSVTGQMPRLQIQKPVATFAVAVGAAAGPLFALLLAQTGVLGFGDGTALVGAVLGALVGLVVVWGTAELASTYPSGEGSFAPLLRAFSPRVAVAGWCAIVVALFCCSAAALTEVVTLVMPAITPPALTMVTLLGLVAALVLSEQRRAMHAIVVVGLLGAGFLLMTGLFVGQWESTRFLGSLERLPGMPVLRMAICACVGVLVPLVFQEGAARSAPLTGRPAFVVPRATAASGLAALLFGTAAWILRGGVTSHALGETGWTRVVLIAGFAYVGVRSFRLSHQLLTTLQERHWLYKRAALFLPLTILGITAVVLRLDRTAPVRALLAAAAIGLLLFQATKLLALWRLRRVDASAPRQFRVGWSRHTRRPIVVWVTLAAMFVLGIGVVVALPLGAAIALGTMTIVYSVCLAKTPGSLPAKDRDVDYYELLRAAGEPELAQQYRAALERGEQA